jgi:hypothetical protein
MSRAARWIENQHDAQLFVSDRRCEGMFIKAIALQTYQSLLPR